MINPYISGIPIIKEQRSVLQYKHSSVFQQFSVYINTIRSEAGYNPAEDRHIFRRSSSAVLPLLWR